MSRYFGDAAPTRRHLVRGRRGVAGEVNDLRKDIGQSFQDVEDELGDLLELGSFLESLPAGAFPDTVTYWTSPAKTEKLKEITYVRNPELQVTTKTTVLYREGVVFRTITESITYEGATEALRTVEVS